MQGFQKAVRDDSKVRLSITGPPGGGKTYSALLVAHHLGGAIGVIDTERGSARKYAPPSGTEANAADGTFDFVTMDLEMHHPQNYIDAIEAAAKAGIEVLIIDSLSHAWVGKSGALELADKAAARYKGNSYAGWRDVTPLHVRLIDAMVSCPMHLIVTMRSKVEYVTEKGANGKMAPRKVGLAPVQREGMEFEFDVTGDIDDEHRFIISKTRCKALDGAVIEKPGEQLAAVLKEWLAIGKNGAVVPPTPAQTAAPAKTAAPPNQARRKALFAQWDKTTKGIDGVSRDDLNGFLSFQLGERWTGTTNDLTIEDIDGAIGALKSVSEGRYELIRDEDGLLMAVELEKA